MCPTMNPRNSLWSVPGGLNTSWAFNFNLSYVRTGIYALQILP